VSSSWLSPVVVEVDGGDCLAAPSSRSPSCDDGGA